MSTFDERQRQAEAHQRALRHQEQASKLHLKVLIVTVVGLFILIALMSLWAK